MDERHLRFGQDSPAGLALFDWWKGLQERRGERAELKRCRDIYEVMYCSAYHRLRHALKEHGIVRNSPMALVAGLAAGVKNHDGSSTLAEQMAKPREGSSSSKVSELRFRRLLAINETDELFAALTRIVRLLRGQVNLGSLATGSYWWGPNTKKTWAFDYFGKTSKK